MPKAIVVQNPADEVPAEILASAIRDIANAIKKMRASQLNDRAIVLLLHDASGVGKPAIKNVLCALDNLAAQYLKKKP